MIARILVVEDSSAMHAYVRAALEEAGMVREVVEASSGFEALRLLPREAFGLAIVDINMPDVNGLELIHFMRRSDAHRDTPLLIISSEASERDRERGLELGADAYLAKPFTAESLVEAVRALVPGEEAPSGEGARG